MKKLFVAAILTITVAASAFAKDKNIASYSAVRKFNTEFTGAQNVNWTVKNGFAKASFDLGNVNMEAFFDVTGNMIGTSKHISLEQLPMAAKKHLAKKYSDYTIKEAINFESDSENAYYVSAENDEQSLVLKIADNTVSIFKKENKK